MSPQLPKECLQLPALTRRQRCAVVALVGSAALLAVLRAGRLDTFWCDESYTAGIQALPVARIWSLSAADTHPPLYYLLLKGWAGLLHALGLAPGLFAMRLPGVVCWCAMIVAAWGMGRRLMGEWGAAAVAVLLAFSGATLYGAVTMRQNAVAVPAMFAAWLLLLTIERRCAEAEGRAWRGEALSWAAYAVLLAVCSWGHALVIGFAGTLGVMWLVLAAGHGRRGHWRFVLAGAAAHALVVLAFLPYLETLRSSIAFIDDFSQSWQTPATTGMLSFVYLIWYPFGPLDWATGIPQMPAVLLGSAALMLPGALLVVGVLRRDSAGRGAESRNLALVAASGLGVGIGWPLLTWLVDRAGIAAAFHGSRHPYLALGPFVAGLVAALLWARERGGFRRRWVVAALAPWAVYTLLGYANVFLGGRTRLGELRDVALSAYVPPGEPLYVVPGGLAETLDGEFAANALRRLEDLPADTGDRAVYVAEFHYWPKIYTDVETEIMTPLRDGSAGSEVLVTEFPKWTPEVTFYRVRGTGQAAGR